MPMSFGLPSYMGQTFTELCKLAIIINDMLRQQHDDGDKVAPIARTGTSLGLAEDMYSRLLQWSDSLPVAMARELHMPHHVAVLQ